jgi:hypothetical protein
MAFASSLMQSIAHSVPLKNIPADFRKNAFYIKSEHFICSTLAFKFQQKVKPYNKLKLKMKTILCVLALLIAFASA